MSLFSIVCIVIVIYIFGGIKGNKEQFISLLAFHIFVCTNIEVGAFITIGGSRIKYNYFTEVVMVLFSVILMPKVMGKVMKSMKYVAPSLLLIVAGIINMTVNPIDKLIVTSDILIDRYWDGHEQLGYPSFGFNVVGQFIQYMIFIIVLIVTTSYLDKKDYKILLKKIGAWYKIAIICGCVEFVIKNVFSLNIFIEVIEQIFGHNDSVFVEMERRGSLYRLSGLTTEAAHFAYALFVATIIMFANCYLKQEKKGWFILSFLTMVFSMSFTSTLYAIGIITIVILVYAKKDIRVCKRFLYVCGLLAGIAVVAVVAYRTSAFQNSYYGVRLNEILNDQLLFTDIEDVRNYTYTSSRVRLVSIITTLSLLKYRPLIGIGIGVASSHGSFALILAELGILGTFFWIRALFFNYSKKHISVYKNAYCLLIILWCVIGLVVGSFLGFLYNAENYALMTAFLLMCDRDNERNRGIESRSNGKKIISGKQEF